MSDDKKPSFFGRLVSAAREVAGENLAGVSAEAQKHLKVDIPGKNFRISHEMFTSAIRTAAKLLGWSAWAP